MELRIQNSFLLLGVYLIFTCRNGSAPKILPLHGRSSRFV